MLAAWVSRAWDPTWTDLKVRPYVLGRAYRVDEYLVLDDAGAAAFLSRRFGSGVSGVVEIGRGAWATAFGFELDGAACVARFAEQADDFAKDGIAAAHAATDLPIPRILEIGEAPGGFYAISERAYGTHLDALDEAGMRAALPSLFAMHDAMRLADVSRTTGYGGFDASGNAPHATWRDALLALPGDFPSSRMRDGKIGSRRIRPRGRRSMRGSPVCAIWSRCVHRAAT